MNEGKNGKAEPLLACNFILAGEKQTVTHANECKT